MAVVAFNNSEVVEYQIRSLRKFFEYPFRYTVYDNSTKENVSQEILAICKKYDVGYVKLPKQEFLPKGWETLEVLLSKEYIDCIWSDFSRAFYDDKYLVFFMSIRLEVGSGFGFGNGLLFSSHNEERVKALCLRFPDAVPHKIAEIAPCFEYEESDDSKKVVGFSHILIWLLDSFGADKSLLSSIHANIHSFQWTGSLIPYFTRNIYCFKKLLSHSNQNVRNWAKECIEAEQRDLEQEQKREEFETMHYNV